ncbi:IPT/TIG domain-containing protein [Mucilaginibacter paludis]|uniref:NHL repeat containing protein n=1 Tax=Mucilaginibacter paludis DSM 18603 TaxID=714943 RepID=H1Y2E7_9SPHI|nr:IPT/TIG domain-containing protein [Mucilaginibacter paludis]EHQ27927.1 NHL repeat containing protein [Mucilaginibacter paludis DSM 18603]
MNNYLKKTGMAIRYGLLPVILISFIFACKKSGTTSKTKYDPNLPVLINSFTPDSGGIRTKIVIFGSNFGSDKSIIKVFFTDNEKDRAATIVGVNNEIIYCLVPKQNGGINNIKVIIGTSTTIAKKTFQYTVAQSVSNIVGVTGVAGSINGSLSDGRIQRTFGIAALGNDELISFETLSSSVRYISVTDNKISTLQTGFDGTQPALNAARTKMYSIGRAAPHKVYAYSKSNLWQPQILSAQIPAAAGLIFSAALDDTEQWLYFRDKNGVFGRLEIANPTNIQVLNPTCGTAGGTDYSYLCYSKTDDCFYLTVQSLNGVYKVSKDGKTVETYAGFNGLGQLDAAKNTASFNSIAGICTDSEGNIYVVDSNTNLVRKINRKSGYVSTIAGIAGVFGGANGVPRLSSFNYPYCIQTDNNDNIFIGESWGCTIRKLAIE